MAGCSHMTRDNMEYDEFEYSCMDSIIYGCENYIAPPGEWRDINTSGFPKPDICFDCKTITDIREYEEGSIGAKKIELTCEMAATLFEGYLPYDYDCKEGNQSSKRDHSISYHDSNLYYYRELPSFPLISLVRYEMSSYGDSHHTAEWFLSDISVATFSRHPVLEDLLVMNGLEKNIHPTSEISIDSFMAYFAFLYDSFNQLDYETSYPPEYKYEESTIKKVDKENIMYFPIRLSKSYSFSSNTLDEDYDYIDTRKSLNLLCRTTSQKYPILCPEGTKGIPTSFVPTSSYCFSHNDMGFYINTNTNWIRKDYLEKHKKK